jgi:hypothetical protein
MTTLTKHRGILGLTGIDPVGAVLSIGRKETFGKKDNTDRFWLVQPREENGVRLLHPAFEFFNKASDEKRQMIKGNIVHAKQDDCYWDDLTLYRFPKDHPLYKKSRPNSKPFCVGDGINATRWVGPGPDDCKSIPCPNDRCEFRIGKHPVCKPSVKFLFRIAWDDPKFPSMLVRFDCKSWWTAANFNGTEKQVGKDGKSHIVRNGFFGYLENIARELGISDCKLFGFPFIMTLTHRTKPSDNYRFPVVTIAPAVDPVMFFMQQRSNIKLLAERMPILIADEIAQEPDVMYDEPARIQIGRVSQADTNGAAVVTVEPEPMAEKTPTAPSDEGRQKAISSSKNESASPESAVLNEIDGKNGHVLLFPAKWAEERKKLVKRIKSAWKDISEATLGNNIVLNSDKDIAIAELRFRIHAWQRVYSDLGETDEWNSITIGGDIMSIPESPMKGDDDKVCLASVAAKLLARWNELKKNKKAA